MRQNRKSETENKSQRKKTYSRISCAHWSSTHPSYAKKRPQKCTIYKQIQLCFNGTTKTDVYNSFWVATGKILLVSEFRYYETRVKDEIHENSTVGYFDISDACNDIVLVNALEEIENVENLQILKCSNFVIVITKKKACVIVSRSDNYRQCNNFIFMKKSTMTYYMYICE